MRNTSVCWVRVSHARVSHACELKKKKLSVSPQPCSPFLHPLQTFHSNTAGVVRVRKKYDCFAVYGRGTQANLSKWNGQSFENKHCVAASWKIKEVHKLRKSFYRELAGLHLSSGKERLLALENVFKESSIAHSGRPRHRSTNYLAATVICILI